MKRTWPLTIDCPNCAAKLEAALNIVPGAAVAVDYVRKTITLTAADADFDAVTRAILKKAADVEPDAVIHVSGEGQDHHAHHEHEHGCCCGHEHHEHGCCCGHDHHDHDHGCSCSHNHHDHDHGHDHPHDHGEVSGKALLLRVGAAAALLAAGMLLADGALRAVLCAAAYLAVGYDVLWRALRNIRRGQIFDENFLMAVASLGAMLMGEYAEGAAVMGLYQVGEYFQDKAVEKSRHSIASLMDIRPDWANLLTDGQPRRVSPEEVRVGDLIQIRPGEKVPLDGVIVSGASSLNTTALTGESLPRDVGEGDSVLSGCVNESGLLTVRVTAAFGESTVAKILELVENSGQSKAATERFITRFARVYTPLVCLAAVLLAVIPSLMDGLWLQWIERALTFLVISCPCALVISVPLSFYSGIGKASAKGVLVKGANHIETLAQVDTVVLDKTGTLTRGDFRVRSVHAACGTAEELLEKATLAEQHSDHPISRSIQAAWGGRAEGSRVSEAEEIAGRGVRAVVDGVTIHAGNALLMQDVGAAFEPCGETGTVVYVAADGAYLGCIVIADEVKATASAAMAELKKLGVKRLVMLTGDQEAVAAEVAAQTGMTEYRAQLLPGDKVSALESLLGEGHTVAFVGDGINDAPVLRRADVGLAMGGVGSDAAIEAADVVLMDDELMKLPLAIRLARKTMRLARQNIVFSLGVKGAVLILGALGLANMWLAVFADVGVCMLAILNAIR